MRACVELAYLCIFMCAGVFNEGKGVEMFLGHFNGFLLFNVYYINGSKLCIQRSFQSSRREYNIHTQTLSYCKLSISLSGSFCVSIFASVLFSHSRSVSLFLCFCQVSRLQTHILDYSITSAC